MIEFEINGIQYRAEKLNAMTQFHVSRRIAPIIPTLIPLFMKLNEAGALSGDISKLAPVLQPLADGLAGLSDEHSEFIIGTCLSVVQRQTGPATWARVWSAQSKVSMFDDMDMLAMIKIVIQVIQDSLGSFIAGMLTSQQTDQAKDQVTG